MKRLHCAQYTDEKLEAQRHKPLAQTAKWPVWEFKCPSCDGDWIEDASGHTLWPQSTSLRAQSLAPGYRSLEKREPGPFLDRHGTLPRTLHFSNANTDKRRLVKDVGSYKSWRWHLSLFLHQCFESCGSRILYFSRNKKCYCPMPYHGHMHATCSPQNPTRGAHQNLGGVGPPNPATEDPEA